ncbi:Gamma-aminobutyric acid type B receptor subunit 2 [Stylophora pistillata]|uniref:Gamma-aminobutyric acid type B receptor subunit 2 n=2 Tax=Stylophora pistillata TaxID=50429 RepID=A0A2B4SDM2_STYPI|nr:Gamma-aminobutyric acid type B receptor subunit 2 [Stylophora pistillata]
MTTFQNASGIIETVNEAVRSINERSQLLPGYKLEIEWKDTKCQLGHGVQALFQSVNESPTKIMLLGGMCSAATRPIAECSHLLNLIQVGYGASSIYLSDKEKYPLFFRTVPPEKGHNSGRLAVLKYFNWKRIAILIEREPYYEAAQASLTKLLEKNDISIVVQEFLGDGMEEDRESLVKFLKARDARIIVGLFSEEKAVEIFCQAYKQDFYGKKYVWMLIGWYQSRWWNAHPEVLSKQNCKAKHVVKAFGSYVTTDFLKFGPGFPNMIGGESAYHTWKNKFDKLGLYSGFAHDALFAMVLALNHSAGVLAGRNKTLADFTYNNSEMATLFKTSLSEVSFRGFSGHVYFNDKGEREGIITVHQMQDQEIKMLGNYTVSNEKLVIESSKFVWEGGSVPADQMTTVDKLLTISRGSFGFFCAVEVLGIIIAVVFLAFNISHSSHRFIKMSSPRLNNVIVVGAILIYIAGILLGIDGTFASIDIEAVFRCRLSTWVACLGFTLGFGGMFLKTWRVHKIFLNRTKKMIITDFQLFAMLGLFLSIDLLILMVWEIIDPLYASKRFTGREEYSPSTDTNYKTYYIECTSNHPKIWLGVVYAYKGLMLAFGAMMAWETRNVTFAALNDSKHIGISVYNVVFPCALGMTIVNVVAYNPDVFYAVLSVLVVFCTTITLCIVFVPKITTVKADPLGKNRPRFVSALNHQTTRAQIDERLQLQPGQQPKQRPDSGQTQEDSQRTTASPI